jgi:hypothetical protein
MSASQYDGSCRSRSVACESTEGLKDRSMASDKTGNTWVAMTNKLDLRKECILKEDIKYAATTARRDMVLEGDEERDIWLCHILHYMSLEYSTRGSRPRLVISIFRKPNTSSKHKNSRNAPLRNPSSSNCSVKRSFGP